MANDEEVDDFGGLESSVTHVEDVRMEIGEQPAPLTGPCEDPVAAAAPSGSSDGCAGCRRPCRADRSFAGGGIVLGVLCLGPYLCDTKSRLLRRFRRLGLRKQPLLMMLILWRPRMRCLLMKICLVWKLGLGRLMGLSLTVRFCGLKSL
jgi:hypothetical protein